MPATFTPPLAAITTIFTPPCPITWLLTSTKAPSQFPSFATTAPVSCDPPSWGEYISQRGFEYYSPAICPSGFSVGPSCIITNPRTAQGFPAIQGGETAAYCVPSGHTCTSDTSDFRGGVWGASRTASANGAQVTVGPAIQIRWRDQDLSSLETNPLTPGPRTTQVAVIQPPGVFPSTVELPPTSTPAPENTLTVVDSSTTTSSSRQSPTSVASSPSPTSVFKTSTTTATTTAPTTSTTPTSLITTTTQSGQTTTISASISQSSPETNGTGIPTQSKDNRGNTTSKFTVAAIVLTTVLISIILGYGIYAIRQRYQRYRAGEAPTFFLFEMEASVRRFLYNLSLQRRDNIPVVVEEKTRGRFSADAELGTEGPLTELGSSQPFGTKENPAELPTSERWSWRSRVSRMLTVRPKHGSSTTARS
ncbi:hypothetical protein HD806DRAFT_372394 [Xylariaceae sp. AK1471]|nr:hypothetical protein HD806DRAFT_372394 [Xylariaceae sp. AK1471]